MSDPRRGRHGGVVSPAGARYVQSVSDGWPTGPSPRRRRVLVGALALAVVFAVGAAAGAGYLAYENRDRADRWQARAADLERQVESLNDVLVERSQTLNERTEELNEMAAKVRRAERAVARSEADVLALERRQRQLANEKAQVEDARAALALERDQLEGQASSLAEEREALAGVAVAFITCKNGLEELLDHVLAEDFGAASAVSGQIGTDCDTAESELDAYIADYGE